MTDDINEEKQNEFQKSAESRSEFGEMASVSEQIRGIGGDFSTNYSEGGWRPAPSLQGSNNQIGKKGDKKEKEKNTKEKSKTRYRTHIRLSEKEFNKLKEASIITGKTIPFLLRQRYFRKKIKPPMFAKEDATRLLIALNKIGNKMSEISRAIGGDFREGFNPDIRAISKDISLLKQYVCGAPPVKPR